MKDDWLAQAREMHRRYPVVDAHCDTISQLIRGGRLGEPGSPGQVDLRRLQAAGIRLVFFSLFVEPEFQAAGSLRRALCLLDCFWQEYLALREQLLVVREKKDLAAVKAGRKLGVLLTLEGGEALEGELGILRQFYRLGVRGAGLTWNRRNALAGGIEESRAPGLSDFGAAVVREMNRWGMLIDVSHLHERAFWEVLEVSRAPVVASHANAYRLCPHPRNLKDEQLRALAARGGVVGVTFVPAFVAAEAPSVERVADHLEYLCQIMGVEAVGLGSDFDGTREVIPGLEDAAALPHLTACLLARGWREEEVGKILGGNWLRLLEHLLP